MRKRGFERQFSVEATSPAGGGGFREHNQSLPKGMPSVKTIFIVPGSREGWSEYYLIRFRPEQLLSSKKTFVISNRVTVRHAGLSPDKRWYYRSGVGSGTLLGEFGKPKFKKLDERLFECRFSPDSRYLLGSYHFGGDLVLFDLRQDKKRLLHKGIDFAEHSEAGSFLFHFGWYPDSRFIWFSIPPIYVGEYNEPFFQMELKTGRKWRLSSKEIENLKRGWGMLDTMWARFPEEWQEHYLTRYSLDYRVRLRAGPHRSFDEQGRPILLPQRVGRPQLILEWRDGRSQVLIKAGEHQWERIEPQDVTPDGRWVLCIASRPLDLEKGKLTDEAFVMDTHSGKHFVFDSAPGLEKGVVAWGLGLWFDK